MSAPITFITYVRDAQAATGFYRDLLGLNVTFDTPDFVAFDLGAGTQFALWYPRQEDFDWEATRTSELCVNLPTAQEIDATFQEWKAKGVTIVSEPEDAVFGRTFVAADPDGNLIRVAPVD